MKKSENASVIGKMMILEGLLLIAPLFLIPFFQREITYIWNFLIPALVSVVSGAIMCYIPVKNNL